MKGYGPLGSTACKWGPGTNSYINIIQLLQSATEKLSHILTHSHTALYGRLHVDDINSSTQLCMSLSKPLLHNVLNLDTVELDLISSLNLFHVLIPTIYFGMISMRWLFELGVYAIAIYALRKKGNKKENSKRIQIRCCGIYWPRPSRQ